MKSKEIKSLQVKVESDVLYELSKIRAGCFFQNFEESDHLIINVPWLIEILEDAEDSDGKLRKFVDLLDTIKGVNWREMTLILLTAEEPEQED